MKVSRVWALGWVPALVLAGFGVMGAAALDTPHTLHRARTTEPHLIQPHRSAAHHAASHASSPSSTHASARNHAASHAGKTRASAAHSAQKAAPARQQAHLTARGKAQASTRRVSLTSRRHHYRGERFTASSFANSDIFSGDITAGEDPVVRQAAIDAMGDMNGTAVVIDPSNGRILAMVNQKLALSPGAEPCSTIKITVAMAALSEGLVTRDTPVQLAGFRMNMTQALAKSNNLYFEELGRELGFDRVRHYATQFGLGELAGYHIDGEQLGAYPDKEISAAEGGVARMCSFGQGVGHVHAEAVEPDHGVAGDQALGECGHGDGDLDGGTRLRAGRESQLLVDHGEDAAVRGVDDDSGAVHVAECVDGGLADDGVLTGGDVGGEEIAGGKGTGGEALVVAMAGAGESGAAGHDPGFAARGEPGLLGGRGQPGGGMGRGGLLRRRHGVRSGLRPGVPMLGLSQVRRRGVAAVQRVRHIQPEGEPVAQPSQNQGGNQSKCPNARNLHSANILSTMKFVPCNCPQAAHGVLIGHSWCCIQLLLEWADITCFTPGRM